jgi:hypothetical protein
VDDDKAFAREQLRKAEAELQEAKAKLEEWTGKWEAAKNKRDDPQNAADSQKWEREVAEDWGMVTFWQSEVKSWGDRCERLFAPGKAQHPCVPKTLSHPQP